MITEMVSQIIITVAGGFLLNVVWSRYSEYAKRRKEQPPHVPKWKRFSEQIRLDHPLMTKIIRYLICYFLVFALLDGSVSLYRRYNHLDKDWVTFNWILCEDSRIGLGFLSSDYNLYAQRGNGSRELIVRQVHDGTLVQIYYTDFDMEKPNILFSLNNRYVIVTEKKNVNLFDNINGELLDSFQIKDEEVKNALILEDDLVIFLVTSSGGRNYRIGRYEMSEKEITQERTWENVLLIGQTQNLDCYLGIDCDTQTLFAASLRDLAERPVYGGDALRLCANGTSSFLFDEVGKYYLELITSFSTRIEVKRCADNKTVYTTNIFEPLQCFFDEREQLYIVHQGYVERVNLLTGRKQTIIDLSTIAQRKREKRVEEDYVFVRCCLIDDSNYLAGIVYEPSSNYNRIYIFDMDTEEIAAMSNSLGELGDNGYAFIEENNEILYATIVGPQSISAVYYPLVFSEERELLFSN